jgi:SAM-dependent methyltransferase
MSFKEADKYLNKVEKLYTKNWQSYGSDSRSVGWKDEKGQNLRFHKLVQVIEERNDITEITVNDYGCGYGAMFKYLDKLPNIRLTKYYGYDISKEMLTAAGQYVNDERAQFINSKYISFNADYSFVSGTFNVRFDASGDVWREFIEETLLKMGGMSKRGFAFNLLSIYVDWQEQHLYYGDPHYFFDFCRTRISKYVSLLHDYPLYEWTICVRAED